MEGMGIEFTPVIVRRLLGHLSIFGPIARVGLLLFKSNIRITYYPLLYCNVISYSYHITLFMK